MENQDEQSEKGFIRSSQDFKTDPERDASPSIRGYVYQIYQSVLAWIQLKENEILVLEGAEDFDVRDDLSVITTQIKDVSGNLTLRSQDILDSINNFWLHCKKNPDYIITFRFLTTAEAGQEQGLPFGSGEKGLLFWQNTESEEIDIEPLRTFLLTLNIVTDLASFIKTASDNELREKLIRRIKWDLGNKPREALQYNIEDKLIIHGSKNRIDSHYSRQTLPHLLKKVADFFSTKGIKELRLSDFLSFFDEATTVSMPRGELEAIRAGIDIQQVVGRFDMTEIDRFTRRSPTIGNPLPIVDGYIARTSVVSSFAKVLLEQHIIFLCGSSGIGKTNLASLISHEINKNWGWVGFRNLLPEQIKDVLMHATFEINTKQLPPFLVMDDIDLTKVVEFERELISLIFSVINSNGLVILTGPHHPPLQLLPKLWRSEVCDVTVSNFDETEIADMVRKHGLSDKKRIASWVQAIWYSTSGHPQLVHARVRNLRAKGWPDVDISDLTKPEDVERIRSEARNRLVQELPSENTRTLAYRLSLILGGFSRETAIAVAEAPPTLKLPGESFDELVGPWIEREGKNRYRISPLLMGAAIKVLSATEIIAVHGAISLNIIGRKEINPIEAGMAFYHAYYAKEIAILLSIASKINLTESKNINLMYRTMTWFTYIGLGDGEKILPENPAVDFMLRLAQYKLIASSPEPNKAITIIEKLEEYLKKEKKSDQAQLSEWLAYGIILNAFEVQIPSSVVIRMLSRMIDLLEENPILKEQTISSGRNLPRLGENKPAQVLFSFQAARLSGLDDLKDLILALDELPLNKRDHILSICSTKLDFANLLINQAWWKEVRDGKLEVNKALEVFDLTEIKSRDWKEPSLTKASLVAKSIIQDEYGHNTGLALSILDIADKEFPEDASLLYQRAKVLFHANRESEALLIAQIVLKLPGLANIDFIYCCRDSGIAAASTGDWFEAERLFLLGFEKSKQADFQKNMGIGLMADAAFTLWKQEKFEKSLTMYADVLDSLTNISISDDIRNHHLHAMIRHSISWIYFDAQDKHSPNLIEPIPGMCSNQEPHERIIDHRIIDINASWSQLASTERILELNGEIKSRSDLVTGGKRPLILESLERSQAFESLIKKEDFDNIVPVIVNMVEGVHHTKTLKENQDNSWAIIDIPKLPLDYWENPENWGWGLMHKYLLVASVIDITENTNAPNRIERWRTDLQDEGILTDEIHQFLNALNGETSKDTFYQQAATFVFKLRKETLSPAELLKGSFRLLEVFMSEKHYIDTAIEVLLIPRWISAINNQRFAFSQPNIVCPEIEKCCFDLSIKGLSKVAALIDISAPYLNIKLSLDAKQMIKRLIEQR